MIDKDNVLSLMESLALMMQDSAEIVNMNASVYADMENRMVYLANRAKELLDIE